MQTNKQTNKHCVQASEGDRGQRASIKERTQGAPQSNTKCMQQGKEKGNKGTRPDTVTSYEEECKAREQ